MSDDKKQPLTEEHTAWINATLELVRKMTPDRNAHFKILKWALAMTAVQDQVQFPVLVIELAAAYNHVIDVNEQGLFIEGDNNPSAKSNAKH